MMMKIYQVTLISGVYEYMCNICIYSHEREREKEKRETGVVVRILMPPKAHVFKSLVPPKVVLSEGSGTFERCDQVGGGH
jgi:hypothetical protein